MPRTTEKHGAPAAYRGEVWTDGQGRAVVVLPPDAKSLTTPVAYTLEPCEVSASATVTSELRGGQFTIETDEPHVKVAWRIAGEIEAAAAASDRTTETQSGEES